ncbi:hypothetical protein GBAR_LOCUS3719, partial [Geodia barretti]
GTLGNCCQKTISGYQKVPTDCSEHSISPGSLHSILTTLTMYCSGINCCLLNDSGS